MERSARSLLLGCLCHDSWVLHCNLQVVQRDVVPEAYGYHSASKGQALHGSRGVRPTPGFVRIRFLKGASTSWDKPGIALVSAWQESHWYRWSEAVNGTDEHMHGRVSDRLSYYYKHDAAATQMPCTYLYMA